MSLQSEHPPLTWDRIEQLAQAGHDDFEAPINNKRARQLVESVRGHFAADTREAREVAVRNATDCQHLRQTAIQLSATLERVTSFLRTTTDLDADTLARRALALASQPEAPVPGSAEWNDLLSTRNVLRERQPEAPDPHTCDWFGRFTCRICGKHRDQPEAPKGPAVEAEAPGESLLLTAIRAANAEFSNRHDKMTSDLAAANARIAELEDKLQMADCAEIAANARADAAEREVVFWKKAAKNLGDERIVESNRADAAERKERDLRDGNEFLSRTLGQVNAERDQLAARVTELERWYNALVPKSCAPEERQVLEAMEQVTSNALESDEVDRWPSLRAACDAELVRRDVQAELANRAAKAKRAPLERSTQEDIGPPLESSKAKREAT